MQFKEQFPEGRYWWMVSNPDTFKKWCLLDMPVGEEGGWNQRSDNGRGGRLRGTVDAFREIRKGDWILGYMGGTTYPRGVYSLLKCTHGLTKDEQRAVALCFVWTRQSGKLLFGVNLRIIIADSVNLLFVSVING